jgi:hypothetical protein
MRRRKQNHKNRQLPASSNEAEFVEDFEKEYAPLVEEEGLQAAKTFFRENFAVKCFACGYMGKTVPPLNCAQCGSYLD